MNLRGKRELLQSFDYLLYCLIVYTYFLDASFLLLILRFCLQLQLISSGYTFQQRSHLVIFLIICTVFLLSACIHLFSTVIGEPGIIIDFIGNHNPPTLLRLVILDLFIVYYQIIRLYISFKVSQQILDHTNDSNMVTHTLQVPPALAHAFGGASQLRLMIPSRSNNNNNNNNNSNNGGRRRRIRREVDRSLDNEINMENEIDQDDNDDSDNANDNSSDNDNNDDLFYHNDLIIDITFSNLKSMVLHSRHSSNNLSNSDDTSATLLPI